MKILVDTHTHTNASAHAFGTVWENVTMAKKHGLTMICMTNHAPAIGDAPHIWHFETMHELPDEIDGIRLLKGVEANVLDTDGSLDIPENMQRSMDVMIASIHRPCFPVRSKEAHTQTWLNVIKNPYVTILGHTGHPSYPYDHEPVIEAAKENHKCIEINNHSFYIRKGCLEHCRDIALCCKKMGANIVVSSDAHTPFQVGVFDEALALLKEIDFPQAQIMNLNQERFERYLQEWKDRR